MEEESDHEQLINRADLRESQLTGTFFESFLHKGIPQYLEYIFQGRFLVVPFYLPRSSPQLLCIDFRLRGIIGNYQSTRVIYLFVITPHFGLWTPTNLSLTYTYTHNSCRLY